MTRELLKCPRCGYPGGFVENGRFVCGDCGANLPADEARKEIEAQFRAKQEAQAEEIRVAPWPELAPEALYGLAGDVVRVISPCTEADPVALLTQFLVAFGNVVGRGPHFTVEADQHYVNLFAVLVGISAKGRKGTSWGHIRRLFETVAPDWANERIVSGLSSGEGLIEAVRDPFDENDTGGVRDKRLLVQEAEFSTVLRVLQREGNTLSAVLRDAWDGRTLRTLTRKDNRLRATSPHISIVAHVTKDELLRYLDSTECGNGFGNRFLWINVRRSRLLPEGGNISQVDFAPLLFRLKQAINFAKETRELKRDETTRRIWAKVYPLLSQERPGLLGALTARAEAQVVRLSAVYALLDLSDVIRREHLAAALALWGYVEDSVRFVFGDALGDVVMDTILNALRMNPRGLSRTEISALFDRHRSKEQIARALSNLLAANLVQRVNETTNGRPSEKWFAVT